MSNWAEDFVRRVAEPLDDQWPISVFNGESGAAHVRRQMVAKRDIAKGEVLFREKPLLCIASAMLPKFGTELRDPKMRRWVGGWVLDDDEILNYALKTDDVMFEYIFEKIAREHSELFRNHAWMDEFAMHRLVAFRPHFTKDQIRLVRSLAERGMRDCIAGARKFLSLFATNSFMCQTVFGGACYGRTVFHYASYFNHSCAPNAMFWHNREQEFIAVAARPIAAGEEVCIAYTLGTLEVGCLNAKLPPDNIFNCTCATCARGESQRLTSCYDGVNEQALSVFYASIIEHAEDAGKIDGCWVAFQHLMQTKGLQGFLKNADIRSLTQFVRVVTHIFARRASKDRSNRSPFLGLGSAFSDTLKAAFDEHFQKDKPFFVRCRDTCTLQLMWLLMMEQYVYRGSPTGRDSVSEGFIFHVARVIRQMYNVSFEIAYDMIEQSCTICGFQIPIDTLRAVTLF